MATYSAKFLALAGVLISLFVISCHKEDQPYTPEPNATSQLARTYSGEPVTAYYTLACHVARTTPGFFPPQVARAYGYMGLATYESVVYGIKNAKSLSGQINGLATLPKPDGQLAYNWAISSNAAIAEMMRLMFDKNLTEANRYSIDSLETETLQKLSGNVSGDVADRSVNFGKSIAKALYDYSTTDGGHESYLDPFQLPFTLPTDSFCWVPTGSALSPVSPKWGDNRPFLQADVETTAPEACVPFSIAPSSAFYQQAVQVYDQVKHNTPDEVEITEYWADDPFNTCTPAGHTFNILTQLLRENKATLEKTSVAYAKMSIAENDAFIACWKSKYQYMLIRPVSYINKYIDASFKTVIGTPPFPAYVSGHSCEIGAGAVIFTNLFTDGSGNYDFVDNSQYQYGFLPRHYSNFEEMADECAQSRLYGGIHYPMDNEKGLVCGKAVGTLVNTAIQWPTDLQ